MESVLFCLLRDKYGWGAADGECSQSIVFRERWVLCYYDNKRSDKIDYLCFVGREDPFGLRWCWLLVVLGIYIP
jgi:hypothetical protein